MSNKEQKQHFTQPLQFDKAILAARQEKARHEYMEGFYQHNTRQWQHPATEVVEAHSLDALVDLMCEKALQGQQRYKQLQVATSPMGFSFAYVFKPQEAIEADLKALFEKVEADYNQELQDDLEAKRQILISQMVAQEKLKEEKKLQEKEKKILDQATADADAYIQSLMKEVK